MPKQKKEKLIGLGVSANLLKRFIELSYEPKSTEAPEGYELDKELSGSRVKVYTKKGSKEVIVVHRGSVGSDDWIDNAKYFAFGSVKNTKTFKLHKERQLKAIEKYGANNIIGIGHSRAGLYLEALQKEYPIKEIITYNKAVGFYDMLRKNPEEQTDVKVKNDFVSLLSGLQKRPNKMVEIEATSNPLDLNKAHQASEIEKLGTIFIGKKDEMEGGWFAFTDAQKAREKRQNQASADAWDRLTFGAKTRAKLGESIQKSLVEQTQKQLGLDNAPKAEGGAFLNMPYFMTEEEKKKHTLLNLKPKRGGVMTKKALGELSKKELLALNKQFHKEFKSDLLKKPLFKKPKRGKTLKGGGLEQVGRMLWSGLNNASEEMRIKQEAGHVLDGVKVWHLPFWKPADHIWQSEAEAMVEARAKELGMEALRDKISNEVGFDIRTMNNNKALGMSVSGALDALSYTPLGIPLSIASSTASQLIDNKMARDQQAEENRLAQQREALEAPEEDGLTGGGTAPTPKTIEQLKIKLLKLEKQREKLNKGKVYKTTNIDKVNYEISYIKARLINYETKGIDLIITKKKKYGDAVPKKAKPYKPKPKKEVGKLDFLKLGENYTKLDFITAVNKYIKTNKLETETNAREFKIDKNLSKLFNIEENKLITYFQAGTLFKPTISELFKTKEQV